MAYIPSLTLSFNEDFEQSELDIDTEGNSILERIEISDTKNQKSNSINQNLNNYIGLVRLTHVSSIFKGVSRSLFKITTSNTGRVYLEFDYKNNQNFILSMRIKEPNSLVKEVPLLEIKPSEPIYNTNWKHIYVDLTPYVTRSQNSTLFGFSIDAKYSTDNTQGELYFDNIKVIY